MRPPAAAATQGARAPATQRLTLCSWRTSSWAARPLSLAARPLSLAALALTLATSGCDRAPAARHPGQADADVASPSGTASEAQPVLSARERSFDPTFEPASQYGADPASRLTPAQRELAERVEALSPSRRGGLSHRAALSQVAEELARAPINRFEVPPRLVDGLLSHAGISDPPPRLVIVEIPEPRCAEALSPVCEGAVESLLEEVAQVFASEAPGQSLQYGVGVGPNQQGGARLLVALQAPAFTLEPLPRAFKRGAGVQVRGALLGGRSQPRVEIVPEHGDPRTVEAVSGTRGEVRASFTCEPRGRLQVEVLAEGAHGPEVVANFPIWCAQTPDARVAYVEERVAPGAPVEAIVHRNLEVLNAERSSRGLAPLRWDAAMAAVAQGHSQDMLSAGYVGHRSPTTGDVAARFRAAKIPVSVLRENVARGYGPVGIHDSLMASPGHRVNLLAEDVTHVGIGAVIGEPETASVHAPRPVFLTQVFARVAADAPADPQQALTQLVQRVARARADRRLPAMKRAAALDKIAAAQLAAVRGEGPVVDTDALGRQLGTLGYAGLERFVSSAGDPAAFDGLEAWALPGKREIGVALSRDDAADGSAPLWRLVVVVATR